MQVKVQSTELTQQVVQQWREMIYEEVEHLRRHGVNLRTACVLVADRLELTEEGVIIAHFRVQAGVRTIENTIEEERQPIRKRTFTALVRRAQSSFLVLQCATLYGMVM